MPQKKAVRRRERRRMSRADAQLSMRVEGAGADSALASIVTESRNISGSGIYCLSPHYVAPLSKIAVTIVLPGLPGRMPRQRLLKCEGLVVRCQNQSAGAGRAFELACSFLGLEESSRQLLDEYVMWRNIEAMRHPAAGARRVRNGAARTNRTGSGGRAPAARATSGTAATRATTRRRAAAAGAGSAASRRRRTLH